LHKHYKTFLLITLLLSEISLACSPGIYQDPQYHLKLSRVDSNKDAWSTLSDNEQDGRIDRYNDFIPLVRINDDKEVVLLTKSKHSAEFKHFTNRGMSPIYKIKNQKHFYFDYEKDEWIENNQGELDFKKYGKSLIDLANLEPMILASFPDFTYNEQKMILTPMKDSRPMYFWQWYPSAKNVRSMFLLLSSGTKEEELKIKSTTVDKKSHEIEYSMSTSKMAEILRYPSFNFKFFLHFLNIKKTKREVTFFVKNGQEFDRYKVPDGYLLFSNLNCTGKGKCIKLENRGLPNSFLTKLKNTTGYENHFHFSDDLYELKDEERNGHLDIPAMIGGKFVKHSYQLSWIKNKKFESTKSKWESFSCPGW